MSDRIGFRDYSPDAPELELPKELRPADTPSVVIPYDKQLFCVFGSPQEPLRIIKARNREQVFYQLFLECLRKGDAVTLDGIKTLFSVEPIQQVEEL